MTKEQKQYIEKHTELIEHDKWEEFFRHAPGNIESILYTAGINFLPYVDYISTEAFKDMCNLENICIPHNITSIHSRAFMNCINLKNIDIPFTVKTIEFEAFRDCTSLSCCEISNGTTHIGRNAFYGCTSLETIKYKGTVEQWLGVELLDGCFHGVPTESVICRDGIAKLSH